MQKMWDSIVGLGDNYLTGMSDKAIAKINAAGQVGAANARAGETNWTIIAVIGGAIVLVIGLVFAFRK